MKDWASSFHPFFSTSVEIVSRSTGHDGSTGRPYISPSRTARSMVTQHMTFEYTWWRGACRSSQMPWSGSCQRRATASAMACTISQSWSVTSPRASASFTTRSTTGPKTSSWTCWFARLPTRTGREPA